MLSLFLFFFSSFCRRNGEMDEFCAQLQYKHFCNYRSEGSMPPIIPYGHTRSATYNVFPLVRSLTALSLTSVYLLHRGLYVGDYHHPATSGRSRFTHFSHAIPTFSLFSFLYFAFSHFGSFTCAGYGT
ncbi:hypothetical protein L873DRAFT_462891 [Choiromyces venosus 120613-1]|uniref:Secreted protein n=1 Tax=Choiromyces venosus 120613-1 TaxID=1336337 RepID=A0A3N4JVQ1_9PEZI|nr:hypothetical protein L873DRAFT_462891 [Choiromyces venosus 120613-1]